MKIFSNNLLIILDQETTDSDVIPHVRNVDDACPMSVFDGQNNSARDNSLF